MRTRKLMSKIDVVTQMLDDLVRGKIIQPSTGERESNLKFIIARKWNSWYPSYFLTQGGCYAFVTRDSGSEIGRNSGVIVIDPGVKFSENLRKYYDIEPTGLLKYFKANIIR